MKTNKSTSNLPAKQEDMAHGYMKTSFVNSLKEDIILYNVLPHSEMIIYPMMAGTTYPDPDYFVKRNKRARIQITYNIEYVVSGKGYIELDGKKYKVKAGDFFFFNRYIAPYYYSDKDDPMEKIWVSLCGTFMNGIVHTYRITEPLIILRAEQAEGYILRLHELIKEGNSVGFEKCSERFMIVLLELFQYIERIRKSEMIIPTSVDFDNLTRYIRKNLQNINLTSEYLCEHFHISYATLYRMCVNNVGLPPQQYIERERLTLAKDMLLSERITVTDISERLKFSSSGYFCKVFKKNEGCSPTEWKKRELGKLSTLASVPARDNMDKSK